MTIRTSFVSGMEKCAAWLSLPDGAGPHPVVLLVHGGGATHAMLLAQYEQRFSAAGFAVLAFDFRHLGESEGEPRQLMDFRRYFEDIEASLGFIRAHPELDGDRIALWGTSFGASHVVTMAARHPELAAAVVQCPILTGRAPALSSGLVALLRLTGPILSDVVRRAFGRQRRYVQIVGRPGEAAFVSRAGVYEKWMSVVPEPGAFANRVPAGTGLAMLSYNAAAKAKDVRCPLLVCVSDKENLMDPAVAVKVADAAPRGRAIHYPADHFDVYFPPLFERIVADQIEFLSMHLGSAEAGGDGKLRVAA